MTVVFRFAVRTQCGTTIIPLSNQSKVYRGGPCTFPGHVFRGWSNRPTQWSLCHRMSVASSKSDPLTAYRRLKSTSSFLNCTQIDEVWWHLVACACGFICHPLQPATIASPLVRSGTNQYQSLENPRQSAVVHNVYRISSCQYLLRNMWRFQDQYILLSTVYEGNTTSERGMHEHFKDTKLHFL